MRKWYNCSMEMLWTIETKYETFNAREYNEISVDGDIVYLPYSGEKEGDTRRINYIAVDKSTGRRIESIPIKVEAVVPPEVISYGQKKYVFGDKEIRVTGAMARIECYQNDKLRWKFNAWAYLYTDIIEKNGCIVFGTDGMGGRLYCLDIETGRAVSETKTHFSGFYDFREFNWHKGNIVVYGKGTLVVVDPFTGEIVDEHKIPAKKYPYRSFLKVINGYAYCCVTTDDNRHSVICFALN